MSIPRVPAGKTESRFAHSLPAGRDFFRLREVSEMWRCHEVHVMRLIESGAIAIAADLRLKGTSKAMVRIPRAALLDFLDKRAV